MGVSCRSILPKSMGSYDLHDTKECWIFRWQLPRFVGILEEWAPRAEHVEVALEEYGCNTVDGSEIRRSPVDIW